jgi:hypothetical protein
MPVGRMPVDLEAMRRLSCAPEAVTAGSYLFDISEDPNETNNLAGGALETEYADLMASALREIGAPAEQFTRVGL